MLAITWTGSDFVALGALAVAAITVISNSLYQKRRMRHDVEQSSKHFAAEVFADAFHLLTGTLLQAEAKAVLARRENDRDGFDSWFGATVTPEVNSVLRRVDMLMILGWTETVQSAAASLENAIRHTNNAMFMLGITHDASSWEEASEDFVQGDSRYRLALNQLYAAITGNPKLSVSPPKRMTEYFQRLLDESETANPEPESALTSETDGVGRSDASGDSDSADDDPGEDIGVGP